MPQQISLLAALFAAITFFIPCSGQTMKKTIHVTVTDAATGKTIEGAKVTYKGMFTSKTETTDAGGQATIQLTMVSRSSTGSLIVTDGEMISSHSTSKTTIVLLDNQDYYDVKVSLLSNYKIVAVAVNDKEGAVMNAKVSLKGAKMPRDETGLTSGNGTAELQALLIDNSKTLPVIVEKDGYVTYKGSITITQKIQRYTINVNLERDPNVKTLRVTLTASDDNLPIPEASIEATGPTVNDYYTGYSDANGFANIAIKTGGEYTININHNKFKPVTQKMMINRYDDKEIPPISLRLERKETGNKRVGFIVTVFTQSEGAQKPVPDAQVTVEQYKMITGTDGKADFGKVFYVGNVLNIHVKAKNYEEYSNKYTIENDRRYTEKESFESWVILKYKREEMKMLVQVLDEKTNRPIGNASVTLKTNTGKVIDFGVLTNARGEAPFSIRTADLADVTGLKVTANAAEYQERWSDVPISMTTSDLGMYTIFLKKKEAQKEAGEKMYGPFTIPPGTWVSTGLSLKKGQSFRVEASGIIQYKDPPNTQNTPDGGGYWGWWQLKGMIRDQLIFLGSKGGGTANQDGMILLGAPATTKMGHAEEKALEGHYTVYVFSKYAVEDKAASASRNENLDNAKKDLEFIQMLQAKGKIPNRSPVEIGQEVRRIIMVYNLPVDYDICAKEIRVFHEYFYNRMGEPTEAERVRYDFCLESMANSLKKKIGTNNF